MDYSPENWGDFVSLASAFISALGLLYAFLTQRSAQSAEQSANGARQALTRTLCLVDVQESIDLIDRLKDMLLLAEWALARELYSSLQSKLSDVRAALPEAQEPYRKYISDALREIDAAQGRAYHTRSQAEFEQVIIDESLEILNIVQQNLRTMRADMMFSGEGTGI